MGIDKFNVAMFQAMEAAQVGFHFEEGGCWGMAAALFQMFDAMGLDPELRYRPTGFVHCWVEVAGTAFDWRGAMQEVPAFGLTIWGEHLVGIAAKFGINRRTLESDAVTAFDIVKDVFEKLSMDDTLAAQAG